MRKLWVHEPRRKGTRIGQQEQPFAVAIQPASRINTWHVDVVGQRGPALCVCEFSQNVVRFPEANDPFAWAHRTMGRLRIARIAAVAQPFGYSLDQLFYVKIVA